MSIDDELQQLWDERNRLQQRIAALLKMRDDRDAAGPMVEKANVVQLPSRDRSQVASA